MSNIGEFVQGHSSSVDVRKETSHTLSGNLGETQEIISNKEVTVSPTSVNLINEEEVGAHKRVNTRIDYLQTISHEMVTFKKVFTIFAKKVIRKFSMSARHVVRKVTNKSWGG
ncbi:hypothetical protein 2015DhaA_0470 [Vibrio phage ICP1]|nr:hypothetical protein 2015DhaA_0470 [Vibrio phage ICP1]HEB4870511.1 hypothetical protein [Vibrio cholerae]